MAKNKLLDFLKPQMVIPILYGSQKGNGLHLANVLKNRLKNSFVLPIDSFDILKINDFSFIIFICSTHGDGQCPFNMAKFYRLIWSQPTKIFNFNFAVLGLGDSSYPKYNYCAKILTAKLKNLGATLILREFCNSQDVNGIYDGFNRFCMEIKTYLSNNMKLNEWADKNKKDFAKFTLSPNIEENITVEPYLKRSQRYKAQVLSNNLITPEDYKNCVFELILDIPDYENFYPGDCIAITPQNSIDPNELMDIMNRTSGFNLKEDLSEQSSTGILYSKEQIDYIIKHVDLNSIVHQDVFKDLVLSCKNEMYKKKLLELSEDYDLYHNYVIIPRRTVIEIIIDFELEIPYDYLITMNPIMPRYYSFSKINGMYHILYNDVNFKTYLLKARIGLCSEYLKSLKSKNTSSSLNDQQVESNIKTKQEKKFCIFENLPANILSIEIIKSNLFFNDRKLLFFATGTGVTLPRSVIHFFKDKEIRIYYGFRHYDVDQLCKEEFKNSSIFYASSRDDGRYVMEVYRNNPVEAIDEWLVFASGNSRLNKEIKKLLFEVHGKEINFQSETW